MAAPRDPQTHAIIGAVMEVHRLLGCGFSEPVYQDAMAVELGLCGIPFQPQVELCVRYKDRVLKSRYKPDFICFGDIIVELKALVAVTAIERSQVLNSLKVTGYHRGLLLNFGAKSLQFERLVLGPGRGLSTDFADYTDDEEEGGRPRLMDGRG